MHGQRVDETNGTDADAELGRAFPSGAVVDCRWVMGEVDAVRARSEM